MPAVQYRLFGSNRPHRDTNARHRALLRKALEVVPPHDLEEIFRPPAYLRIVMGERSNFFQMGRIIGNLWRNGGLVFRESDIPDLEVREALRNYLAVYDRYFKKQGIDYVVRNPAARDEMQAAEQGPQRPNWALEALPTLDRVRLTRVQPATAVPALARPLRHIALPTPPPSSPVRGSSPIRIDSTTLSPARPLRRITFPTVSLPSPPSSSPVCRSSPIRINSTPSGSRANPIDLAEGAHQVPRRLMKRKQSDVVQHLGVIDISDDDEEETERPRKIQKLVGLIDLTS
ncbi:hypothetical protein B0H12DRAFT_1078254 [Mycena haematopus]|nr:hypothetical protein B0H12DRAFT_1078254 [Mycena haematopus]